MKVSITNSCSEKLRGKRIEIDQEYCIRYNTRMMKEGSVECETPTAYMIKPPHGVGVWIPKEMVSIMPDAVSNLDRWV